MMQVMQQAPMSLTRGRKELKFKTQISVGVEVRDSKVVNILPSSELLGTMFVGDIIIGVNGTQTPTTPDFIMAVNSKLPGSVVLEYLRDEMCTYDLKPLPPRKAGYDMFEVTLIWRSGGTPIGLLIHRDFSGRVVIAMVESGCTASKVVKAGDILVKVNATEVFDRDVARKMIMESINASKRVTLTLERCLFAPLPPLIPKPQGSVPGAPPQPEPPKPPPLGARSGRDRSSTSSTVNTKLDVVLPADVVGILEANKNFFRAPCSLPPCLKKVPQSRETLAHLNMPPSPTTETTIPYDPSPKPLKATPKRLGS